MMVTSESFGREKPVSRICVSVFGTGILFDEPPDSVSGFPESASTVMRWQMALLSGFLPRFRLRESDADGGDDVTL